MQLTINHTDNDRLKTTKAQNMLRDLGVLPDDHSLRPSFLRSYRTAATLIDRALSNIQPVLAHHCRNSETLAAAANEKFSTAYIGWPSGPGPAGGSPPAWVRTGAVADIDFVNDPPRAWVIDTEYNGNLTELFGTSALDPSYAYDPGDIDPGVGFGNGNRAAVSRAAAIGPLVDAFAFDFTLVLEYLSNFISIEWVEPTFGTDFTFKHSAESVLECKVIDVGIDSSGVNLVGDAGSPASVKAGLTVTAAQAFAAVAGTLLINDADSGTTIDPSTPNPITEVLFNCYKLKRLTVYNPVKTDVELQALTA